LFGGAIPDSGGTHQYNVESGSGNISDNIGSLTGTLNGTGDPWVTGGVGAGDAYVDLDGSDQYFDLGTASQSEFSHFPNGNGTVFAWINPDNFTDFPSIFVSSYQSSNVGVGLRVESGGDIRWGARDGSGNDVWSVIASGVLSSGTWTPVAATADGSTAKIYAGKSLTQENSGSISNTTNSDLTNNVNIGRDTANGGRYFDGGLDLIWTDSTAQSQSNIQSFVDDSKAFY